MLCLRSARRSGRWQPQSRCRIIFSGDSLDQTSREARLKLPEKRLLLGLDDLPHINSNTVLSTIENGFIIGSRIIWCRFSWCLAVEPTQFKPPPQTRQNSLVRVVSGVAIWISFEAVVPEPAVLLADWAQHTRMLVIFYVKEFSPCLAVTSVKLSSFVISAFSWAAWMPAKVVARAKMSFTAWCLAIFQGTCLQTRPWHGTSHHVISSRTEGGFLASVSDK